VEIKGAVEPLDVAVAWTKDKKSLTISVINPTFETQQLGLDVTGVRLASQGKSWVLTAPDDMAYNDPGKEPVVRFTEKAVSGIKNSLTVAPASATIFELAVK
jgi:alpha-L-arabinofuranosidase